MPQKKYLDFVEGTVVAEVSRHAPYTERNYTPITCPHCTVVFIKLPSEQVSSLKASKCLQHLRVCEAFKAKGGEVATAPEKKKSEIDALKEEMVAMKGDIATIWSMMGGGDPPPTTLVELKARVPQKMDEIGSKRKRNDLDQTYRNIKNDPSQKKEFDRLYHQDSGKTATYGADLNTIRKKTYDEYLDANARG